MYLFALFRRSHYKLFRITQWIQFSKGGSEKHLDGQSSKGGSEKRLDGQSSKGGKEKRLEGKLSEGVIRKDLGVTMFEKWNSQTMFGFGGMKGY